MKLFIWISLVFLMFLGFTSELYAQKPIQIDGFWILPASVVDGDTIPNVLIPQIVVFPQRKFASKRDYRQYHRLVRNLKVVYPYAQIAKFKISEMDAHYRTLKTDRARKAYTKQVEQELRAEFEGQLVKLTISQGRLLIKLIDREVGRTSYEVIRDLRGGVSAVFWQTLARLFGSNLKTEFETAGEDKILNELILLHEHGLL
jgi:asparagine N-glycosylation enzyme membrane subunit Stt3